jgi:putative transposase
MVLVNMIEMEVKVSGGATLSRTPTAISLNKSLGIMLASYTRALNKRNNTSGSIFRSKTKAECVNCPNGITPSFIMDNSITKINTVKPEEQYPKVCFDYIHANPVKAKLVKNINDWPFSSASDYAGIRDGKLVNKQVAYKYIGRF